MKYQHNAHKCTLNRNFCGCVRDVHGARARIMFMRRFVVLFQIPNDFRTCTAGYCSEYSGEPCHELTVAIFCELWPRCSARLELSSTIRWIFEVILSHFCLQ